MSIYIRSSASISPQQSFGAAALSAGIVVHLENRLRLVEPDYTQFIDHKSLRRMSHVIKMGITSAKECLKEAAVAMPGAIVVGTAYGCMESSSSFLLNMIRRGEDDLSPSGFMQSTHNTVAAQIALMLKCHAHNNTFVHKGFSFESALQDAIMLLNDEEAATVLVGGIDEMTDMSFVILSRLGLYKRLPVSNLDLFTANTKGTICGEGAAFFLLSGERSSDNLARLTGLQMFYRPADINEIELRIEKFLAMHGITISDIDLILTGKNGDPKNDHVYNQLGKTVFINTPLARYKHLCGDYPTSTSFALWLAAGIVKTGVIPEVIKEGSSEARKPRRVLVYNYYLSTYHSLILLSDE